MDAQAQSYVSVLFPDRFRVCGRWLVPMTLGHLALMQRVGLPFAEVDPKPGTWPQIVLGAWICSQRWDVARDTIEERSTRAWLMWHGVTTFRRARLASAITWRQYLTQQWDCPSYTWVRESDEPPTGMALVQSLIVTRMSRLHATRQSALDTPLSVALWDKVAWMAAEGFVRMAAPAGEEDPLVVFARQLARREAAAHGEEEICG